MNPTSGGAFRKTRSSDLTRKTHRLLKPTCTTSSVHRLKDTFGGCEKLTKTALEQVCVCSDRYVFNNFRVQSSRFLAPLVHNPPPTTRSPTTSAGISIALKYGGATHNTVYNALTFNHDPHVLIAGQRLNIGCRALREYASKRGFEYEPLVKVLNTAVAV